MRYHSFKNVLPQTDALKDENDQLRSLTHLAETTTGVTVPVVSSVRSSRTETFIIGAGSAENIIHGSFVLSGGGFLVGTVSRPLNRANAAEESPGEHRSRPLGWTLAAGSARLIASMVRARNRARRLPFEPERRSSPSASSITAASMNGALRSIDSIDTMILSIKV